MKNIFIVSLGIFLCAAFTTIKFDETKEKEKINTVLDAWHKAAAEVKYDTYFNFMTEDAIFIGTDATENWNKTEFQAFAKPYFDKGKAWNFTAVERHVYFDKTGKTAWFDEMLNTQMKICRGSGVLVKIGEEWKIKHYVLSMTVPNDNVNEVIKIKAPIEDVLLINLQKSGR
ncbi:nuclear transport factor 2 family protein [Flavobacterium degerlachei]|uniref:SnoaL-like domain-containing protein n=1 Tax=Flavobacterium degerlachei TaxID=229203 RepID=A0A1H2PZE4_9FLAO|nr:nuclear transport factor 2 family protein [Flavobacterium degerlachei]SDW00223.1 SnoaL-like domain-containing protein [Flavobacterium degerlachei]